MRGGIALLLALAACAGSREAAGLDPDDAGLADDAGEIDAGSHDAGAHDGGHDAGSTDAGAADAGSTDAGSADAGPADAGIPTNPLIQARPYTLHIPAGWDGVTP